MENILEDAGRNLVSNGWMAGVVRCSSCLAHEAVYEYASEVIQIQEIRDYPGPRTGIHPDHLLQCSNELHWQGQEAKIAAPEPTPKN